ncbi:MAG: hypothetical protein II822_11395 [Prevotella sp.]|nr:hypothetical protein [Prevotella sp.]
MKKRNEDNSNIQNCNSEGLSDEDLEELNRLLERLHQADYKALGSINVNIYKPGSQHVDRVERQYISLTPNPSPKGEGKGINELPEALSTETAMSLWQKAQQAGYVDENYQPTISRTQSALLADAMAERLGIREKWKVFESLWNRKNMYRDYYKALNLQQSLTFQDKIKRLFR